MVQASTTHASLSHACMVLSLSFQGDQRRASQAQAPSGMKRLEGRTYAGGTSGRNERQMALAPSVRARRTTIRVRWVMWSRVERPDSVRPPWPPPLAPPAPLPPAALPPVPATGIRGVAGAGAMGTPFGAPMAAPAEWAVNEAAA